MDRGLSVDVGDEEVRDHRIGMAERLAMSVEDDAVAVEDELVLPADGVDPGHECAVSGRPLGHHRLTRHALAVVVGRAVDVDQEP